MFLSIFIHTHLSVSALASKYPSAKTAQRENVSAPMYPAQISRRQNGSAKKNPTRTCGLYGYGCKRELQAWCCRWSCHQRIAPQHSLRKHRVAHCRDICRRWALADNWTNTPNGVQSKNNEISNTLWMDKDKIFEVFWNILTSHPLYPFF